MEKPQYTSEYTECEKEINGLLDIQYFRALVDPVRVEIITYLSVYGEKNIQEIAQNFPQNRSVISRHLDHLYQQGILKKRKESRFVYYQVDALKIADTLEASAGKIREIVKKYEGC